MPRRPPGSGEILAYMAPGPRAPGPRAPGPRAPGPRAPGPMYAITSPARKWTCEFCHKVGWGGGKADHMRVKHPAEAVIARVGRPSTKQKK